MKVIKYFLVLFILFQLSCKNTEKEPGADEKFKVGLVFDVGGRGDKSFNDSAYTGLDNARKNLGIYVEYIEPGAGADRESALRMFAERGFDLIFGIGFMFADDMIRMAEEYPDIKFACVDYNIEKGGKIPANLSALKFSEEKGSYLVGAIAGLVTATDKVGFIGGMDIPLIHKFEAGYKAGVKKVNPDCKVLIAYAGVTGEAFKNPSKGKELALSQYKNGADIIYHASGSTGLGVFEAARQLNKLAIGVDSDQYHEAPGYILTSMIKRVDVAVYNTIRDLKSGNFRSGVWNLGFAENFIDYVYDENNKSMIPLSVIEKVEHLKEKIIKEEIEVPIE